MGVRSSLLHHSERSGRWVLARQSRYDDGFPADDAGGLCAGVREDGGRRKVRDGLRTIHSSAASSKGPAAARDRAGSLAEGRSEEHTSELQSPCNLVCRLLLEKKNRQCLKPGNLSRGGGFVYGIIIQPDEGTDNGDDKQPIILTDPLLTLQSFPSPRIDDATKS